MDQCTSWYIYQQYQSDPGQREHSILFPLNMPYDWSLCCLYPYTDLLLAARQQPVSVSIKLGVEDNTKTFLEPVWTQCQHLQYKSSWDVFSHIRGAQELDLLHHWTTASEACPKCKEIALWGHFASISPFGSVPLCLQGLHIHWLREHENNFSEGLRALAGEGKHIGSSMTRSTLAKWNSFSRSDKLPLVP